MAILVCEICDAQLGTFDPDLIELPLTGDQFGPVEPGFPRPFWLDAGWSELICPHCHSRAVGWDASLADGVRRDRIKTPEGYFVVGKGYERKQPIPFVHDSSNIAAEWEAVEAARRGGHNESVEPKPIEQIKRPYHRKDKKRGR